MPNILVIDDDPFICKMLVSTIKRLGYNSTASSTIIDGLERLGSGIFDAVFLDVIMPDGVGLEIIPKIRETASSPEVIVMTAYSESEGAELAIRNGAWDYLQKPFLPDKIRLCLEQILQYRKHLPIDKRTPSGMKFDGIVGKSSKMKSCFDLLDQAITSDVNVLIMGETGTGKELFASTIHHNSHRTQKNFVVVDCTALPENLIESVLFGHEKGSFTGADRYHEGLIRQADGGTLFLDEISELPITVQKAFLRFLQERRFRPVGSKKEISSDFRLIAATNRDLNQMVQQGSFRNDLLFRIRSLFIEIPPLRERPEEIYDLAICHLERLCSNFKIKPKKLSSDFLEALKNYTWPGNVREVIRALESAITSAYQEPTLFQQHLPIHIRLDLIKNNIPPLNRVKIFSSKPEPENTPRDALPKFKDFRELTLRNAEKEYLKKLIRLSGGHINEACRTSGLSRTRLHVLMKKHNISRLDWNK